MLFVRAFSSVQVIPARKKRTGTFVAEFTAEEGRNTEKVMVH